MMQQSIEALESFLGRAMALLASVPETVLSVHPIGLLLAAAISSGIAAATATNLENATLLGKISVYLVIGIPIFALGIGFCYLVPVVTSFDALMRTAAPLVK